MIQQLIQLGLTEEDATAIKSAADDASASPLVYSVSTSRTLTAGLPPRVPVFLVDPTAGAVTLTLPLDQDVGAEVRIVGVAPGTLNDIIIGQGANAQIHRGALTSTLGVGGDLTIPNGGNSVHLVHAGAESWAIVNEVGTNALN